MIWKTLAGRRIHHDQNGIQVRQNVFYRWLMFDSDAIQTLINRRHPERAGLQYIPSLTIAARATHGKTCLLGLGGAGVAHALGDSEIDAVESSFEVINIAATYFMTDQIKNLTTIHQDAFLFIQETKARYQHLIVDLFDANSFPPHCHHAEFFEHCYHALLPGGILAINLANLHEQWPLFILIREQFPARTIVIPIKGTANMVVLACKAESIKPLLNILQNQARLKQLVWDAQWGCICRTDI